MTAVRPMSARDRGWLGFDNLRVLGPMAGITADGLRESLVRLHARKPLSRVVCRMDREAARWIPLSGPDFAAYSRSLVIPVDPADRVHPADAVTRRLVDEPLGDRPLLLAVGGGFIGAKISHALGDGGYINPLFAELMRATAQNRAPQAVFPTPTRLPVLRAALRHFGRRPSQLVRAVRVARPPVSTQTASTQTADGGDPRRVAPPWRPDVRYCTARSTRALADVRAWRDHHAPGVSAAAVLFAASAIALTRCGIPLKWPGAVVLFDGRRYLPPGGTVAGNFSWGQYLVPADLTDPRAVHEVLRSEVDSGRPLAMLALRTARLMLSPAVRPAPFLGGAPARPRAELTLTHIGKIDRYADLPWTGPPEEHRNMSVPTTNSPEAITLSFSELGGALYLNASFDGSTWDPAAVRRAADLICHDPIGLLSARSSSPAAVKAAVHLDLP